jgi:hypothetical protein
MTARAGTIAQPDAASASAPAAAPVRILCKVGEASLKGRNRRMFLEALRRNLKAALQGVDARVEGGGSVLVVAVPDEEAAEAAATRVERVFAVSQLRARPRADRGARRGAGGRRAGA